VGSTIVKVARLGGDGELLEQDFHDRDFALGIETQVWSVLKQLPKDAEVLICSSANGGLRVGIVCLSKHFSGSVFRDQALLAGANPIFVRDYDEAGGDLRPVDILLLGGGIDCPDAEPLETRIDRFQAAEFRYGTLIYAGNSHLAERLAGRYPGTIVIENPLSHGLLGRTSFVSQALRDAYLDDLVHKEGTSDLQKRISEPIRPTPEVVSRGFHRVVSNRSELRAGGPSILIDIGGATTDVHYTVEIVRDDSPDRPTTRSSVARYVFTDLGTFASRDTTLLQMRAHSRTFEFLTGVLDGEVRETYRMLREGEYAPSAEILCYACLFLSLDRFAQGKGPGLPAVDLNRVAQVILTGGGSQGLDDATLARVVRLCVSDDRNQPEILIDRRYQIWAEGITWPANLP
jgi:hypothetical protein